MPVKRTPDLAKMQSLIGELSKLWKDEERYWLIEWEARQERRELEKISWEKLTELQEITERLANEK